MVADRVKAKGGEGSEDLFELTFGLGQRQATWCVCECMFQCVCYIIIGWMQHRATNKQSKIQVMKC